MTGRERIQNFQNSVAGQCRPADVPQPVVRPGPELPPPVTQCHPMHPLLDRQSGDVYDGQRSREQRDGM